MGLSDHVVLTLGSIRIRGVGLTAETHDSNALLPKTKQYEHMDFFFLRLHAVFNFFGQILSLPSVNGHKSDHFFRTTTVQLKSRF